MVAAAWGWGAAVWGSVSGDGIGQGLQLGIARRLQRRLQADRLAQECHILALVQQLAHKPAGCRGPSAIFDEGDGAVLDIMGNEVPQQLLHGDEDPGVIRCRGKNQVAVAEAACDDLRSRGQREASYITVSTPRSRRAVARISAAFSVLP